MLQPKLAIVGPFPPLQNGIADYIAELWEHQARDFDLVAVIADDAPAPMVAGKPVPFLRAFEAGPRLQELDANIIYHVGNNTDHHFLLPLLFRHPGVVVLHDYCLSYLLETATFPIGDRETYRNWMQHDYGLFGARLADDFLQRGWRGKFMAYALPINGPILASSTALIAHSRYVQFKTAAARPGLPVHFIPHHISPTVEDYAKIPQAAARKKLGLDPNALIITAPGFIARPKLIDRVLAAFAKLKRDIPNAHLVLAGERKLTEYDVDADIARLCPEGVTVTGFLEEPDFFLHLAACDVVVNLRYPTGGESSGTLARAIGLGRACVVLNHGPMGEFPDDIVRKVPFGPDLDRNLEAVLRTLLTKPSVREELAASARAYALAHYTTELSAQRYKAVLESAPPRPRASPPAPLTLFSRRLADTLRASQASALIEADNGFWWRCGAAPFAAMNPEPRKLLAVDADALAGQILVRAFGWGEADVVSMSLDALLAGGARGEVFDYAIVSAAHASAEEIAERIGPEVMRVLARGAALVIEAPVEPRAEPGAKPFKIETALCALGLSQVRRFTFSDTPPALRPAGRAPDSFAEQAVFVGVRTSEMAAALRGPQCPISAVTRLSLAGDAWMLEPFAEHIA